MAQLQSAIGGIPVQQAMVSDFRTLHVDDDLNRAVEMTLSGSQKDFPVMDNGHLKGILTQTELLKALAEKDQHPTVASVIQTDFSLVDHKDMLDSAFSKLKDCNCHTLPVMDQDQIVGLMTMDNLGEYMRIKAAINA